MKNIYKKYIVGAMVALLPMALSAQTQTENYIVNKTYKKPTSTAVTTSDKDSVSTNITYFDGLGRPKQSVAVQAGGTLTHRNGLLYDWTLGTPNNSGFYNLNGLTSTNQIVSGTTPFGDTDLLWECINDMSNTADGGWNTDNITIDPTKAYRYTVWVKKTGNLADGNTYHGVQNGTMKNLDGTTNSNPYFWNGNLPQLDTWYLMVGYVHPHDYTGSDTGISGVYDTQGTKVLNGTEFKWDSTATSAYFRNYLYYASNAGTGQFLWSPLLQEIDGSELPLNQVINTPTVVINGASASDIVTPFEYDSYGRQLKEYLPYSSPYSDGRINANAIVKNQEFYLTKHASDFAGITDPTLVNSYSEKFIEASPLARVFEQTAPGADWKKGANTVTGKGYSDGHSIRFEYDTNTATEVKLYTVSLSYSNYTYTPTLSGGTSDYPVWELTKTVTKDENWVAADGKNHTTEEFKNKSGQVILKRTYADIDFNKNAIIEAGDAQRPHDTYYVYDDYGNLSFVIPPKVDTSDGVSATELSELCYQYKYDHRNRLIEKKIPGKGWEYIVYNRLDQPILTQDANLKAQNKWLFTKYDKLGRVAYTGIWSDSQALSAVQGHARNTFYANVEDRSTSASTIDGNSVYYTNTALPISSIDKLHTVNYYDTYADLPSGFTAPTSVYGQTVSTNTKGLATVSKVKVLSTSDWITTLTYYDEKGRPIYVYSKNDYLGTTDIVESKLDSFTGKLLETKTTHQKTGQADVVTIDRMTYDHMDRVITQTQKVNNQTTERLVQHHYDEMGQLESKLVGNGAQKGYTEVTSNIIISGDLITKSGADNDWTSGLSTLGTIAADGYLEFSPLQNDKYVIAGLSDNLTSGSYEDIDYGVYMYNLEVHIFESGTSRGNFGSYSANDVFRVERIGDKVYYKKNGETFYTSSLHYSGSLIGAMRVYDSGVQIKDFRLVDNSKGLQKVDYAYNVRGWLTNINSDADNDNDLFNFSLKYNNPTAGTALFNGNISQASWNTASTDSSTKTYTYSYDALNRITSGIDNTGNYNLESVRYDKNGNILNLKRQGHTNAGATTFGVMDNLTYTYDANSNRLNKVADAGSVSYGFIDGSNSPTEYTYDVNGNMITDSNKNISNISYNHLNLPKQVTIEGQIIDYVYDATGVKIRKTVQGITTDYAGNYIYEDGNLQFFNHAEGYSKYDGGATTALIDATFTSGTEGWGARNGAVLQQDNGRLKVTTVNQYEGTHKFMNATVGDRIEFNLTLDKGTTAGVSVNILEHDSNGTIKVQNLTPDATGYIRGTYLVTEANTVQLSIKFEKVPGADNGTSTAFYVDNVAFVKVTNSGDLHSNVYQYKDNLGNVRLSYADTDGNGTIDTGTEIIEESNYYPFGLKHKGYNYVTTGNGNSTAQRWGFTGKEHQDELGLGWIDITARNYDAALGRWMNLDPLAEEMRRHSPYNYAFNSPVYFIDPDGMSPHGPGVPINGDGIARSFTNAVSGFGNFIVNAFKNATTLASVPLNYVAKTLEPKGGMVLMGKKKGVAKPREYKSGNKIEYRDGEWLAPLAQAFGPSFDNKLAEGTQHLANLYEEFGPQPEPNKNGENNGKKGTMESSNTKDDTSTSSTEEKTEKKPDSVEYHFQNYFAIFELGTARKSPLNARVTRIKVENSQAALDSLKKLEQKKKDSVQQVVNNYNN